MNLTEFKKLNKKALKLKLGEAEGKTNAKNPAREYTDAIITLQKYAPLFEITVYDFAKYFTQYYAEQGVKLKLKVIDENVETQNGKVEGDTLNTFSCVYCFGVPKKKGKCEIATGYYYLTTNYDLDTNATKIDWLNKENTQCTKFNLFYNKYIHIQSIFNAEKNTAEKLLPDVNDAIWYVAERNLKAKRDAKIEKIQEQQNALQEKKTALTSENTMLDSLVKTF